MLKRFITWLCKFFDPTVEVALNQPKTTSRKRPDRSKFTQYDYDFICHKRAEWEKKNAQIHSRDDKIPLQQLVDEINQALNTDKSLRALQRVWSGEIDRNDLPAGKPMFAY